MLKPRDLEFKVNVDPAPVAACIDRFHVAKINGAFPDQSLLRDLRDAIEITDYFLVHFTEGEHQSNKSLALGRFADAELTKKNPHIYLHEIPFAMNAMTQLISSSPLLNELISRRTDGNNNFHTCWARPEQHVDGDRKTEWRWHQDKYFHVGDDVTVWIPLSECGSAAPSVEYLVRESDEILPADTNAKWAVDPKAIEAIEGECLRYVPQFSPGDAIIFDGASIHKTHALPGMTQARTSIDIRASKAAPRKRRKWYYPLIGRS